MTTLQHKLLLDKKAQSKFRKIIIIEYLIKLKKLELTQSIMAS